MSLYWIHFDSDNVDSPKAFGPFENPDVLQRFRDTYGDDEDDTGYRRSVDELPELPGTYGDRDDHESATWIRVQADNLFLLDGNPTIRVQEQETPKFTLTPFSVTDEVSRVQPILSE